MHKEGWTSSCQTFVAGVEDCLRYLWTFLFLHAPSC